MTHSQITNLRGLLDNIRLPLMAIETPDYAEVHDEDGQKIALTIQPALIVAAVNALPSLLDTAERVERLEAMLRNCADDLEAEIEARRSGELPRRIARALLAETADGDGK